MLEIVNGFDWDAGNRAKCTKHGVTREDIESLFGGRLDVFPDAAHSLAETRFLGIGCAASGRYVFVAFTLRNKDGLRLIRPISARYMHDKEVKHYEARHAKQEITQRKD